METFMQLKKILLIIVIGLVFSAPAVLPSAAGKSSLFKIVDTTELIDPENSLFMPISNCNEKKVAELLASEGSALDINETLPSGATPLYMAVTYGHPRIVKMLLDDPRTDVNKPLNNGTSPLHIAVAQKLYVIVEMLLAHPKINVNPRSPEKLCSHAPFEEAVFAGDAPMLELFINHPRFNIYGGMLSAEGLLAHSKSNGPKKITAMLNFALQKSKSAKTTLLTIVDACSQCGASGGSLCGGCRKIYYCSPACQRAHWRTHKAACKATQTQKTAGGAGTAST
jgi:hypothetical protein